jgi:hypothetical protein
MKAGALIAEKRIEDAAGVAGAKLSEAKESF